MPVALLAQGFGLSDPLARINSAAGREEDDSSEEEADERRAGGCEERAEEKRCRRAKPEQPTPSHGSKRTPRLSAETTPF